MRRFIAIPRTGSISRPVSGTGVPAGVINNGEAKASRFIYRAWAPPLLPVRSTRVIARPM